jgi:hypothetical protein
MKKIALIAAMLVLLTGCDAGLTTTVRSGQVESVELLLDDALTKTMLSEPDLDQRLYATFAELAGSSASRKEAAGGLVYRATPETAPDGSLTGLGSIQSSGSGEQFTTVVLVAPSRLIEAITKATAGEPDGAALALAWQKSIRLTVVVAVDGNIVKVKNPDGLPVRADGSVIISTQLDQWKAGVIEIETRPGSIPYIPVGVAVLGVVAVLMLLRRH